MKSLLVVDSTPKPWWKFWLAEPWFQAAGSIASALGAVDRVVDIGETFDVVVFARSPSELYRAITRHGADYVEVWGHGRPGAPLLGGEAIDAMHPCWRRVRRVWFRSCSVAQGKAGHAFMRTMAETTEVVAHLCIIGPVQGYLVGVKKGGAPWWPDTLRPAPSNPSTPRAIFAGMPLPAWAFDEEPLS